MAAEMVLWSTEVPEEGVEAKFTMHDRDLSVLEMLKYHDLVELKLNREEMFKLRDALDLALQMGC